ncbi:acyl-ACP thioesterase domain-containing protein [Streptococcus oricebi]|uniref:Acyl-[acyl-carrier-protein] thioesterase n=1 Tax=Streptococcus oricebi TaxID=1547447 RepID=A0ABS5B0M2_9STRE|nr:acyl-ACP thioesterase domain-containing protein [Streptococcus oricebi]MBP2622375.1 acyl-[acyl-carrier-protein] thioesterase [Streptococcus oricebi]
MALTYQTKMTVPFDMSDINGFIKIPQLLLLSLQVSGLQSAELGNSDKSMLEQYNLAWIVTDYDIKIERLPLFDEEITIETEALSHNRLFCYRSIRIFDAQGQLIVDMLASFVMFDRKERKVHPVLEEIVAVYQSEKSKKIMRGPRYQALQNPQIQDYLVRFYDLDMNGHVNNSKYLDWILEAMGSEFLEDHIPERIQLKYVKEVQAGGLIESKLEVQGLQSSHEISSNGQINAQALVSWKQIKR